MTEPLRIVHYLNQFFGQIGGEDKADTGVVLKDGPVGPGVAVQAALGERGRVVGAVIAGDNFMAENSEENAAAIAGAVASFKPDLLLAGPAFGSGRYGLACGAVCAAVRERLDIPVVAGMHAENPGVALYRAGVCIVGTGPTAASMRAAVGDMVNVGLTLAAGGLPAPGSYFAMGRRVQTVMERTGAERAAAMLVARLGGEPCETELPLPSFERVPPAPPLGDLGDAVIILATEGGLTPSGNPDRIEMSMATRYGVYETDGLDRLDAKRFDVAHGGYDNTAARQDPNRLLPLDALRRLERRGAVRAGNVFYSTAGNATSVANAAAFGRGIAEDIRKRFSQQAGVVLTST